MATAALAVIVGASLWAAGCNSQQSEITPATANSDSKTDNREDRTRCDDLLDSAFGMMQPDRLGIDADAETAIALLNQWLPSCAPPGDVERDPSPAAVEFLQTLFDDEQPKSLGRARFSPRDARHIRNCLLAKATNEFVIPAADDDRERVVRLFDYVCRTVALVGDDSETLPLTPYEILLFGRGTAEDRAWVFAALLRQLRIDAVILRAPMSDQGMGQLAETPPWLIGVLLQGKVYLFDPQLGSALPADDEPVQTPLVSKPAALSEMLDNPELLKRLDLGRDHPYPWTVEDLENARVEVVAHRSLWTPRMKALQSSLAGERSAVIYDGLEDDGTGPALLTRVAEFGEKRWDREEIGVWPHPERSFHGFEHMDDRQRQRFLVRQHPFQAPVRPVADEQKKQFTLVPQRRQLKTRTSQLLGNYESAVRSYLQIRMAGLIPENVDVPPSMEQMLSRAAEDAFFWVGVCQMEQRQNESAAATFRDYLSRYPDGAWQTHCRALLARALAHQRRFDQAVAELEKIPAEAPGWFGYQLWKRRFSRMSKE